MKKIVKKFVLPGIIAVIITVFSRMLYLGRIGTN